MASTSKEKILGKIREALQTKTPEPFPNTKFNQPIFTNSKEELSIQFAENFTKLLGKFSFCLDELELVEQLNQLIEINNWDKIFCVENALKKIVEENNFKYNFYSDLYSCDASITSCEFLIARTGSFLLSSNQQHGRTASVYAPIHICIAYTHQIVYDLENALKSMEEKYFGSLPSQIILASGPSRTADIEKTLVVGVHGPKEVFCFLIDK